MKNILKKIYEFFIEPYKYTYESRYINHYNTYIMRSKL